MAFAALSTSLDSARARRIFPSLHHHQHDFNNMKALHLAPLLLLVPSSLCAPPVAARGVHAKVRMDALKTLTFYSGEMTAGRRTSPQPQLECKGSPCRYAAPDVVSCKSLGGGEWKVSGLANGWRRVRGASAHDLPAHSAKRICQRRLGWVVFKSHAKDGVIQTIRTCSKVSRTATLALMSRRSHTLHPPQTLAPSPTRYSQPTLPTAHIRIPVSTLYPSIIFYASSSHFHSSPSLPRKVAPGHHVPARLLGSIPLHRVQPARFLLPTQRSHSRRTRTPRLGRFRPRRRRRRRRRRTSPALHEGRARSCTRRRARPSRLATWILDRSRPRRRSSRSWKCPAQRERRTDLRRAQRRLGTARL